MNGLGLILPGMDPWPFEETYDAALSAGVGSITGDRVYLMRMRRLNVAKLMTTLKISIGANGSANFDLGYYTFDGTDYQRVAHTGSTAATATSDLQSTALIAAYERQRGQDAWLAFHASNSSITVQRGSSVAAKSQSRMLIATVTFATAPGLPATIAGGTVTASTTPIWIEAS